MLEALLLIIAIVIVDAGCHCHMLLVADMGQHYAIDVDAGAADIDCYHIDYWLLPIACCCARLMSCENEEHIPPRPAKTRPPTVPSETLPCHYHYVSPLVELPAFFLVILYGH